MKATVELDKPTKKFRIRMETCDVVYSPWTQLTKLAWIHYNKDVIIAVMRSRFLEKGETGIFLEAGKAYRVTGVEAL